MTKRRPTDVRPWSYASNFVMVPRPLIELLAPDPVVLSCYLAILSRARYRAGQIVTSHGVLDLDLGQAVIGRAELAALLNVGERSIRTALTRLETLGILTISPTKRGTIVTLCRFEQIDGVDGAKRPSSGPLDVQAPTNNRPTTDQQPTTNEEGKKERREEGREHPEAPGPSLSASGLAGSLAQAPGDLALQRRQKLCAELWKEFEAMRQRVARKLRVDVRPLPAMDPGRGELAARVCGAGDLDTARADCEHVLAVLEAEAIAKCTPRWLDGQVFRADRWGRALTTTVQDAKLSKPADGYEAPRIVVGHGATDDDYADTRGGLPWGEGFDPAKDYG